MATKAELEQKIQDLENVQKEFDDFKKKVVEVGGEYARNSGYCDDYDEMLKKLGLDTILAPGAMKARVTITFDVSGSWEPPRWSDEKKPKNAEEFRKLLRCADEDYFDEVLSMEFGRENISNYNISVSDFEIAK